MPARPSNSARRSSVFAEVEALSATVTFLNPFDSSVSTICRR
jgi:hypothetical protein